MIIHLLNFVNSFYYVYYVRLKVPCFLPPPSLLVIPKRTFLARQIPRF